MLIRKILLGIFLIRHSDCYPSLLIGTGAKSDEVQQQHHDAGNRNVKFQTGTSGFDSASGFNGGNEGNHVQAQYAGGYSQQSANKNRHLDQKDRSGQAFQHQEGDAIADVGKKGWNKKGHHKSGFHNTYRKDESGSNSSYYDDGNDEGGQFYHDSRKGAYGDTNAHSNRGLHLNDGYNGRQNSNGGGYNKGGNYREGSGDSKVYNRQNYRNAGENGGSINGRNQYENGGTYNSEKYVQNPNYYQQPYYVENPVYYETPYYNNAPEKRRITIYEDPRFYDENPQYGSYQNVPLPTNNFGDLVELDVRPPFQPYQTPFLSTKPVYEPQYY